MHDGHQYLSMARMLKTRHSLTFGVQSSIRVPAQHVAAEGEARLVVPQSVEVRVGRADNVPESMGRMLDLPSASRSEKSPRRAQLPRWSWHIWTMPSKLEYANDDGDDLVALRSSLAYSHFEGIVQICHDNRGSWARRGPFSDREADGRYDIHPMLSGTLLALPHAHFHRSRDH